MKTAWIAGATGLVGGHLLGEISRLAEYGEIVSVGRRKLPDAPPRVRQVVVAFSALDDALSELRCDDAFCCLGTTLRQAGSREAFRAVDHTAVLAFAWAAKRRGARRFFVVSALGADPRSRVFYSRVKGEMEESLGVLGFEVLAIFRPGLLVGPRAQRRTGERFFAALLRLAGPLLVGPLRPYRSIRAEVVARAMARMAAGDERGRVVLQSDEVARLGRCAT